ncbi:MAG TPA: alkaline phosphatase family protein [Pseudolabrys sp.]|nr:alkaline phosphatase family protein [Pseudolabrys sp.]
MAGAVRNILFIMCDQLRWDYLSCYGHPSLQTPNLDWLATRSVRFDSSYVQSPVCGPSRASFYTGRTVFSHGSTWNRVPLPVGELTVGDYLRPHGIRTAVVGKTHLFPDVDGMMRLGVDRDSEIGICIAEPGFDPYERDDGIHPSKMVRRSNRTLRYNDWLRELGYVSENPWDEYANSAEGADGTILSGWELRNSNLPARVKEEHSETAYMTDRGIEFITEMGSQPWFLHLSFIKPHWPYMAPAPYHAMYGPTSFVAAQRSDQEREHAHPVYRAFQMHDVSLTLSDDFARETVLRGYMGLVKQIDDHMGRLFRFLKAQGRFRDTMIVFTSDHGDYLGDHWLGEKELFHEQAVRIPLIIYDPSPESDATRNTAEPRFVEAIDLLPTFLEAIAGTVDSSRLEGQSLLPLIRGRTPPAWRDAVFSEIDYSFYPARETLSVAPSQARGYMLRTNQWKYVEFKGYRPQLFDLENDPHEFIDIGDVPEFEPARREMRDRLLTRLLDRRNRVTLTDQQVIERAAQERVNGIVIGQW